MSSARMSFALAPNSAQQQTRRFAAALLSAPNRYPDTVRRNSLVAAP